MDQKNTKSVKYNDRNLYIVTFCKYPNYGSKLQNFALCKILRRLGFNPITLLARSNKEMILFYLKIFLSFFPIVTFKQKVWKNLRKKIKKFKDFNKCLNIKSFSYRELSAQRFRNEFAIVGSDQVWSPHHLVKEKENIKLFFLQFIEENKRIAYAPSFGVKKFSSEYNYLYKNNINRFKAVSVREESGKQIIKSICNIDNVQVVPDPVFLLSKEEWLEECKDIRSELCNDDYILLYFLSEHDNKVWSNIKKYSRVNKLKIISISGNTYKDKDLIVTPNEFIYFINNAKVVITDSFHGVAFSILLEKIFLVLTRSDVEQFTRIDNLLQKYQLEEQKSNCHDFNEIMTKLNTTYDMINLSICKNKERNRGINFLKENL